MDDGGPLVVILIVLILSPSAVVIVLSIRDTIRGRGRWGINARQTFCSECGSPLPRITVRIPTSWRQALWGGWTCAECGFDLDKWGRPTQDQTNLAKWAVLRAAEDAETAEYRRPRPSERIQDANEQTQRGDAP